MLFRTVYGPEIVAIFSYLVQAQKPVQHQDICRVFVRASTSPISTQSVDDALAFLCASSLICKDKHAYEATSAFHPSPKLLLLQKLTLISQGKIEPEHNLDPLYMRILDEVFVKRNCLFVSNLHLEVNKLHCVKEVGGISQEKVQAWKRVMTFLGVGVRGGSGFQCTYSLALLQEILKCWQESESTLQSFFEEHVLRFVPFETQTLDASLAITIPLLELARQGNVSLFARKDTPFRSYLGDDRVQYIRYIRGAV